jgi:hypothetical protein
MAVQKNDGLHRIEFQQWLFRKMMDCIASNVQRAWRTRRIGSIPCSSCGGRGKAATGEIPNAIGKVGGF